MIFSSRIGCQAQLQINYICILREKRTLTQNCTITGNSNVPQDGDNKWMQYPLATQLFLRIRKFRVMDSSSAELANSEVWACNRDGGERFIDDQVESVRQPIFSEVIQIL